MNIEERAAQAAAWKATGQCNCAQAVLKAFEDKLPVDADTLMKLGAGYAAGMGCMESTCGALIGAVMVAGIVTDGKGTPRISKELLQNPAVIKAAKIDLEKTPCMFNPIDVDSQIKSSGVLGEFLKMQWMMEVTSPRQFERIGTFDPGDNKVEIGAATHKIGDKSYILILVTYTPTTPSIT